MRRVLTATLALALLAGCPSYTTMQSPRTTEPGDFELTAGASQAVAFAFGAIPYPSGAPHVELIGNFGLVPNLNLHFRANLSALWFGGGFKLRFVNHPRFQAAIAPEATINPVIVALGGALNFLPDEAVNDTSAMAWTASVPILFGIPAGEHMFIFGPKASITNWSVAGTSQAIDQGGGFGQEYILIGGVVGFELKQANLRILPELDVFYDLWADSIVVQGGIAATF